MAEINNTQPTKREKRSLECSICLMRFCRPKTLPCLHSYCEDCLVTYAPKGTVTLKCPQCQEETLVPHCDASKFKSNFHLRELVEEAQMREQLSQPSTKLLCNCCEEEESEAICRCLDCDQYLCSSGLSAHKRFSAVRDHVIATLDEIRSGKVRPKSTHNRQLMCVKHPLNKAEIFCTTCEIPICHVCATLRHKSPEHECMEATEATEKRRQLALNGLKQLDEVKILFIAAEVMADKAKQKVKTNALECKDAIEAQYRLLIEKADAEKENLYKEVDGFVEEEVTNLEKYKQSASRNITLIQDMQDQARLTVEEANSGDFLSFYGIVKTKIDQLCLKTPGDYKQKDEMFFKGFSSSETILGKVAWKSEAKPAKALDKHSTKQATYDPPKSTDEEITSSTTKKQNAATKLEKKGTATASKITNSQKRLSAKPFGQKWAAQKPAGKQILPFAHSSQQKSLQPYSVTPTSQQIAAGKPLPLKSTTSTQPNNSSVQSWQWPVKHTKSTQQNSTANQRSCSKAPIFQSSYTSPEQNSTESSNPPQTIYYYSIDSSDSDYDDGY